VTLIPAVCKKCGLVFSPPAIDAENVVGLTVSGVATNCPQCGGVAQLIEGKFNVRDGLFEIISAPDMTEGVLRRLGLLLLESVGADEEPDEIANRVESESPSLARWIREVAREWSKPVLLLILSAIANALVTRGVDAIQAHPETVYTTIIEQCQLSPEKRQVIIQDVIRHLKDSKRSNEGGGPDSHSNHEAR
jgi:hypothetical protein